MDLETRVSLVCRYYASNNSPKAALRQFNTENNNAALFTIVRKFEETGSVLDKERSGQPLAEADRADIVKEGVDRIAAANEWGVASIRTVAVTTNVPKSSVCRILRRKFAYWKWCTSVRHQLLPDDYGRRLKFSQWF